MSDVIEAAVAAMAAKLRGGFDGRAIFVIEGEGAILLDAAGVRAAEAEEDADVTLTASVDTFRGILEGRINPTMAFMTGRMRVQGSIASAMKIGSVLG